MHAVEDTAVSQGHSLTFSQWVLHLGTLQNSGDIVHYRSSGCVEAGEPIPTRVDLLPDERRHHS